MQKTQAPNVRSASVAAGRAGRQGRRRSGVWLVPPPVQDEAASLADQHPTTVGALALDSAEYMVANVSVPAPACVLIVEDDQHFAGLLQRALELEDHASWAVDLIPDGRAALMRAGTASPNILLLDVRLSEMDGAEVYRRLRANPATCECQVIFLTASTSLDLGVRGVEGGILLRKPFDVERVTALIAALLED